MSFEHDLFKSLMESCKLASEADEVPIAAAIVKDQKIICVEANSTEKNQSFVAHAELLCIESASKILRTKHLKGCELYVTLEPCQMCFYAARLARIEKIHYWLSNEKFGASQDASLHAYYQTEMIQKESLELEGYRGLLSQFFEAKRGSS